jgi:hypothetical protein
MVRTMTTSTSRAGRYITTCAVVAASGFNKKVTEFGRLSSQSVCLVPGDEYQLVILDSVGCGEG